MAAAARTRWRGLLLRIAIATLWLAAAWNVAQGVYFALQYSQDFQWSPTVLLLEGHDPFAWWLSGNADERILMSQEPNYLHLLYVLLLPFAYLSWPAAKLAWALCSVAAGLASAHILARDCGLAGGRYGAAMATFLAATPFAHVLGNGQQSLFVLLALVLAWRSRGAASGGVFLAAGAVKYSFLPTVGLWMLCERRVSALGVAALALALGFAIFVLMTGAAPLSAAFAPLQVSAKATHEGLGDLMSLARALGLDAAFGPAAPYALGLVAAGASVAAIWRFRRALDDITTFALINLVSLFSLFHHLYDYVLLLPLFVRGLTFTGVQRAATLAYVGYFWFVLKQLDGWPAMKSPAAIALTALGSFAMFALTLRLGAPSLLKGANPTGERIACPSSTVSPPSASRCPDPPLRSPITLAR